MLVSGDTALIATQPLFPGLTLETDSSVVIENLRNRRIQNSLVSVVEIGIFPTGNGVLFSVIQKILYCLLHPLIDVARFHSGIPRIVGILNVAEGLLRVTEGFNQALVVVVDYERQNIDGLIRTDRKIAMSRG